MTWLPGPVRGLFFYLYLILDLYSRKVVGFEVYERESAEYGAQVVRRAVLAEGCIGKPLVRHADNGSPQKDSTSRATLEALGIEPYDSRPKGSDDNAFSEALFRTCKYRPDSPHASFESLEAARDGVLAYVRGYNDEHRHSSLRYVTPAERHPGTDRTILAARDPVYRAAKERHPERWTGATRNWEPIGAVWLIPVKEPPNGTDLLLKAT
jgi:transposase InsO family protein